MCGIVGYIGKKQASQIIIDCLSRLEYRGYDSAGAAIINSINNTLYTRKFQGRLITLSSNLKTHPIKGNIGIGHTRWATHGEPSDLNSHPHLNNKGTIADVGKRTFMYYRFSFKVTYIVAITFEGRIKKRNG